jgi:hypothetical protein
VKRPHISLVLYPIELSSGLSVAIETRACSTMEAGSLLLTGGSERVLPWRGYQDLHRIEHRREPSGAICSDAVAAESR